MKDIFNVTRRTFASVHDLRLQQREQAITWRTGMWIVTYSLTYMTSTLEVLSCPHVSQTA